MKEKRGDSNSSLGEKEQQTAMEEKRQKNLGGKREQTPLERLKTSHNSNQKTIQTQKKNEHWGPGTYPIQQKELLT